MTTITRRALSLGALLLASGLAACAPAATPVVTAPPAPVVVAPMAPAQEVNGRVVRVSATAVSVNAGGRVLTAAPAQGVDVSGLRAGQRVTAQYVPATVTRLAPAAGREGARFTGYNARTQVVTVAAGRRAQSAVAVGETQTVAAGLRRGQVVDFAASAPSFTGISAAAAPAAPARRRAAR